MNIYIKNIYLHISIYRIHTAEESDATDLPPPEPQNPSHSSRSKRQEEAERNAHDIAGKQISHHAYLLLP